MNITIFTKTYDVTWSTFSWDVVYDFFGIKEFVHFISNPAIQATVFPAKIVFIFFTLFLLGAVMYFYVKSSYMHYHYFQGFGDALPMQPTKVSDTGNSLKKILRKVGSGQEGDLKLAIIEVDDFLNQALLDKGFKGDNFEDLIFSAKKVITNPEDIISAHAIRDLIVYDSDYRLERDEAEKILSRYESAIKNVSAI